MSSPLQDFIRDYLSMVCVAVALASIWTLVLMYTGKMRPSDGQLSGNASPSGLSAVESIRKNFDLSVKESAETSIKIKAMFIYPIRGVKGIKVKALELGPYGVKKDRNWTIISKTKMKPIANNNNVVITFLRQLNKPETPNELKVVL